MAQPHNSKLASDDDFVLFGVAIFRRVKDEFAQKCRENKCVGLTVGQSDARGDRTDSCTGACGRFIVRDFTFNAAEIDQAKAELASLETQEKELWTDLLRLSRINFSELFQILVHLKVVRAYVESVLRYGLPAAYFAVVIKVCPPICVPVHLN